MNYKFKAFSVIIIFALILIFSVETIPQVKIDTLTTVKEFRNDKKFTNAMSLLDSYLKSHPKDLNTLWLYAGTAYWINDIKTADELYNRAIKLYPQNLYLQYDYSKMLFNLGNYEEAKSILVKFLSSFPLNEEALMLKAQIDYWQGKSKSAKNTLQILLANNPHNYKAKILFKEVQLAISPWLKIKSAYTSDDQPLENILPSIEGGIYFNSLLNIEFNFQSPIFIRNSKYLSAQWLKLNNKSEFNNPGLRINLSAGVLKYPANNLVDWTGSIEFNKTLTKYSNIDFQYERLPYFYTRSSLDVNLMVDNLSSSFEWNKSGSWNGKIAFIKNIFQDNNSTSTFYVYLFTPAIKISNTEISLGYGYNNSTSKENRFTAEDQLPFIIANYNLNDRVPGIYTPYYTPNEEQVHSILATLTVKSSENIATGLNTSYGFSAKTLSPILTLEKDSKGNDYVKVDYSFQNHSPFRIEAFVLFNLSDKVSLKTNYNYQKLYFYKYNSIGMEIKFSFWNE